MPYIPDDPHESFGSDHRAEYWVGLVPGVTMLPSAAVSLKTGYGFAAVERLLAEGDFPRPVRLYGGRRFWRSDEVESWLLARIVAVRTEEAREAAARARRREDRRASREDKAKRRVALVRLEERMRAALAPRPDPRRARSPRGRPHLVAVSSSAAKPMPLPPRAHEGEPLPP